MPDVVLRGGGLGFDEFLVRITTLFKLIAHSCADLEVTRLRPVDAPGEASKLKEREKKEARENKRKGFEKKELGRERFSRTRQDPSSEMGITEVRL